MSQVRSVRVHINTDGLFCSPQSLTHYFSHPETHIQQSSTRKVNAAQTFGSSGTQASEGVCLSLVLK